MRGCRARAGQLICGDGGADVLNVGFGMGIVDGFIQELRPRSHTIVEAHPGVYRRMLQLGCDLVGGARRGVWLKARAGSWDKKPGVRIIHAKWQDALPTLPQARPLPGPSAR
jgi:protein arginine N-methyltransferase 2